MHVAFLDESGYAHNWTKNIEDQPFYVLSALCVPAERVAPLYSDVRTQIEALNIPGLKSPLGQGSEIKAREIARGRGWWGKNETQRNAVRDLMLATPLMHSSVVVTAVINKQAHYEQYAQPVDPHLLALEFVLERLQAVAEDADSHAICIYDHNKTVDQELQERTGQLTREGSQIEYFSHYAGEFREVTQDMDRVLDLAFGDSLNSLGLQIADFFASLTYQYYKKDQPSPCGWWDTLEASLYRRSGKLSGWGLKVFPS